MSAEQDSNWNTQDSVGDTAGGGSSLPGTRNGDARRSSKDSNGEMGRTSKSEDGFGRRPSKESTGSERGGRLPGSPEERGGEMGRTSKSEQGFGRRPSKDSTGSERGGRLPSKERGNPEERFGRRPSKESTGSERGGRLPSKERGGPEERRSRRPSLEDTGSQRPVRLPSEERGNAEERFGRRPSKDSTGSERVGRRPSKERGTSEERFGRRPSKESAGSQRRGSKDSVGERRASKDPLAETRDSKDFSAERRGSKGSLTKLPTIISGKDVSYKARKGTPKHWNDARFKDKAFLDALFRKFDPGSGSLDCNLMYELLNSVGSDLSSKEVQQLVRQIDLDGNGTVELDEFHFFFSKAKDRAELKSMTKKLMQKDEKAFVKELFKNFDSSGSGSMSEADLFELTEFLNMELSRGEVNLLLKTIDLDGNGTIETDELLFFFGKVSSRNELVGMMKNMTMNNREFLRKVFEMFDPENTGSLNENQLYDVTTFMKLNFSRKAVHRLLAKMDADGNGTVELDEFFIFFDQVKDIKDMQSHCSKNQKSQELAGNVQLVMACAGLFVGIILFVVASMQSEEEDESASTIFAFLGAICVVMGSLFAVLRFGTKFGVKLVKNVCCTCNKKRFMMWGGLCFVTFMILVVMEIIISAGPQTDEEKASLVPAIIAFASLSGMFCFCSLLATYTWSTAYTDKVAPEDTDQVGHKKIPIDVDDKFNKSLGA